MQPPDARIATRPLPREPSTVPSRPATTTRLPALDGLRGVAALVVLAFHVLILSSAFERPEPGVVPTDPTWWLTHTPLYLVWAGPQAVALFFVLSGFVLALPAVSRPVRWRSYYPQRLLRLYLPVWASLVFAAILAAAVTRRPEPGLSDWYNAHVGVGLTEAWTDAVLVTGPGWLNSPLWSLRYEVLFSLLLPAYLLGARLWPRLAALKLLLLVVAVGAAAAASATIPTYLLMFAFGVLMAYERVHVASIGGWLTASTGRRVVAVSGGLVLLTVEALRRASAADSALLGAAATVLELLGACLAIVLALHWAPARTALERPWVLWVGVRSFSLYLVHEPITVTSAALWPDLGLALRLVLVLGLSLVVAHVFHRIVERPAHSLSRRAGRALAPRAVD